MRVKTPLVKFGKSQKVPKDIHSVEGMKEGNKRLVSKRQKGITGTTLRG